MGFVLEVGCGIGRNLLSLRKIGIEAIGVDHNAHSVEEAVRRGFNALTVETFNSMYSDKKRQFDTLLVSHVLEHMTKLEAANLISFYLPYLKQQGRIIVITPQEKGFSSDSTHIEFMNFDIVSEVLEQSDLTIVEKYSFPLPRFFGKLFTHNEFVIVATRLP